MGWDNPSLTRRAEDRLTHFAESEHVARGGLDEARYAWEVGMDRRSTQYWCGSSLQAGLCNDPAGVHGLDQGLVVALVLVGVGTGEVGDGPVEDIAAA
jgi:hypothetical protein